MKVLFVHSANFNYGIESFIRVQGESLENKGVSIDYFPVKGKGIRGYLNNISNLRRESKGFDIIHAHYGLIGLLCVISRLGKPLVLSIMGSDIYGSYNSSGRRKLSSIPIMILTQLALIAPVALIAKSRNILRYIPFKKKTWILPNGVNFKVFRPLDMNTCRKELGLSEKEKIVLFLANPKDPRKNFDLAESAVRLLNDDKVTLLNPYPIQHHEFVKYLNASDVFVLSSFNEGSPNVIKEAMACNVPVVSTDVGDVKEVIGRTDNCHVVGFDAYEMSGRIKQVLNASLRTNGRNDIDHLNSEKIAKKLVNIYQQVFP